MPMREGNEGVALVARALLGVVGSAVVIVACGAEPKKEPSAAGAVASGPPARAEAPEARADAATSSPDAGSAGKPDKQAECDAWLDDANGTLDAERIAVDKPCKKDTDCMPIKGRACGFVCVTGAIPKAEEKDWSEALTKVKEGPCKRWADNECAKLKTKPTPVCQDRKLWCDKGHCALK